MKIKHILTFGIVAVVIAIAVICLAIYLPTRSVNADAELTVKQCQEQGGNIAAASNSACPVGKLNIGNISDLTSECICCK